MDSPKDSKNEKKKKRKNPSSSSQSSQLPHANEPLPDLNNLPPFENPAENNNPGGGGSKKVKKEEPEDQENNPHGGGFRKVKIEEPEDQEMETQEEEEDEGLFQEFRICVALDIDAVADSLKKMVKRRREQGGGASSSSSTSSFARDYFMEGYLLESPFAEVRLLFPEDHQHNKSTTSTHLQQTPPHAATSMRLEHVGTSIKLEHVEIERHHPQHSHEHVEGPSQRNMGTKTIPAKAKTTRQCSCKKGNCTTPRCGCYADNLKCTPCCYCQCCLNRPQPPPGDDKNKMDPKKRTHFMEYRGLRLALP